MKERKGRRRRAGAAAHGYSNLIAIVLVAATLVIGAGVVGMANRDHVVSRLTTDQYAALSLAEFGMKRAMGILEVAPMWGLTGDTKTLGGEVTADKFKGSYAVTVQRSDETTDEGQALVEIVSTGTVNAEVRTVTALAELKPPQFFDAALALYQGYNENFVTGQQGSFRAEGDVYVTGGFGQRGGLCIQGDLIVHNIFRGNPMVRQTCTGGGSQSVVGTITTNLNQHSAAFRDRPIYPARWFQWAQSLVWRELYNQSVPDTTNLSFETVVQEAARADRPYGVLYFVNGNFNIPSRPGNPWLFRGRATVVVNGLLEIDAQDIQYTGTATDSHLVLISLGGIRFSPNSIGPFDALMYTYADGQTPPLTNAGLIYTQTPGGPITPIGSLRVEGTLAGATLNKQAGLLEITQPRSQLYNGPAPGIPGTLAVLHRWDAGAPDDEGAKRRWGIY